jgi:type VI protein secretion system component Hcp
VLGASATVGGAGGIGRFSLTGATRAQSLDFGVASLSVGQLGSGRRQHQPITVTKLVDSSSAALLLATSRGTAFRGGTLVVFKPNSTLPAVQYTLTGVVITHDQTTVDTGGVAEQVLTITYKTISYH